MLLLVVFGSNTAKTRVEILGLFLKKLLKAFQSLRVVAPESGSQWRSAGTGIETLVFFLIKKVFTFYNLV